MNTFKHALPVFAVIAAAGIALPGCKKSEPGAKSTQDSGTQQHEDDTHTHDDGSAHEDDADDHAGEDNHAHDEVSLGVISIGGMTIELAQGHGAIEAGHEGHLVVKLPYNDKGATIVRAWIGTEDRTLSFVGKGEYAASHDDYDIHAVAPDPLPPGAMWWIEVQKPDGSKSIGSAEPIID